MGGGGGKGGSQTQQVAIPQWIADPASRNLARAEQAQRIGYMPYYGPDVAAFTPMQEAAMQANISAAEAFGLAQPGTQPNRRDGAGNAVCWWCSWIWLWQSL